MKKLSYSTLSPFGGVLKLTAIQLDEKLPLYRSLDGFGGLVVSILATGTQVRGFKPGRLPLDFSGVRKILSMPSFGGEVK